MSINGALKKLVTKLGGTSTKKTTEGLINEITANIDGSGSGGGGGDEGSNVYMITFNSSDALIDKTYAEVEKEFLAGKICIIDFTMGNREDYNLVIGVEADKDLNNYKVATIPISQAYCLVTNSKDGYPSD